MYVGQVKAGDPCHKLKKCITINIVDFHCTPDQRLHFCFVTTQHRAILLPGSGSGSKTQGCVQNSSCFDSVSDSEAPTLTPIAGARKERRAGEALDLTSLP
jgi:hypothetical protein